MAARPIFALLSLFFLAGGILLQFLVVLSGAVNGGPVNQVYFLESTTDGIRPAPRNPTRWTYFALCGVRDGHNADCGAPVPALPFDPTDGSNFNTESGVPGDFIGSNYYYLLSRFAWVFFLLALLFAAGGLATGLLALCSRLGGYLSGLVTIVALFFQTMAAALITTWTVKGRNAFNSDGQSAKVGVYALAFTWTALACFFLSTVLFVLSGATGGDSGQRSYFVKRSQSTRSRGSFSRKDDYS